MSSLADLLATGRLLPSPALDVGRLRVRLGEMRRTRPTPTLDLLVRAHYLLAGSGITAEELEQGLRALEAPRDDQAYTQAPPAPRDVTVLLAILALLAGASADFDAFLHTKVGSEWEARKEGIRSELAGTAPKPSAVTPWGHTAPGRHLLGPLAAYAACANQELTRLRFETLAAVVCELNDARLRGDAFPVASTLGETFHGQVDVRLRQMHEVFRIVGHLLGERQETDTASTLADKSRSFLELQFRIYTEQVYRRAPGTPAPSPAELVAAYVATAIVPHTAHTLVANGTPVWVLVFYLLRAGLADEALALVDSHLQVFQKHEQLFPLYLRAYLRHGCRLPEPHALRLRADYNQHVLRGTGDGFRAAVYQLLGRLNLAPLPAIPLSAEDWLWLHISWARGDEGYGLADVARSVAAHADRLDALPQHPLFLQAMVLTGAFAAAVEKAYQRNEADGVHLAVALAYHQLVPIGDGVAGSVVGKNGVLDYPRLVGLYTRRFRASDPRVAAHYLLTLPPSAATELLLELVLETREFQLLIGGGSSRTPGTAAQYSSLLGLTTAADFARGFTERCAQRADDEGRTLDAIHLYVLAGAVDTAVATANRVLADALYTTDVDEPVAGTGPEGALTVQLAQTVGRDIRSVPTDWARVLPAHRDTCQVLMGLAKVREAYARGEYAATLALAAELGIVPASVDDGVATARQMAQALPQYDEAVARNIPQLLVVVMAAAGKEAAAARTNPVGGERVREMREVARQVMVYAGMVQYRMPREVYSKLAELEGGM